MKPIVFSMPMEATKAAQVVAVPPATLARYVGVYDVVGK